MSRNIFNTAIMRSFLPRRYTTLLITTYDGYSLNTKHTSLDTTSSTTFLFIDSSAKRIFFITGDFWKWILWISLTISLGSQGKQIQKYNSTYWIVHILSFLLKTSSRKMCQFIAEKIRIEFKLVFAWGGAS